MEKRAAIASNDVDRGDPGSIITIGLVAHHALGEQSGKWFVDAEMATLLHRARKEPSIYQMQNCMLDAANILVDRQPVGYRVPRHWDINAR